MLTDLYRVRGFHGKLRRRGCPDQHYFIPTTSVSCLWSLMMARTDQGRGFPAEWSSGHLAFTGRVSSWLRYCFSAFPSNISVSLHGKQVSLKQHIIQFCFSSQPTWQSWFLTYRVWLIYIYCYSIFIFGFPTAFFLLGLLWFYILPPPFLPVFGIIKCYHLIFLFLLTYTLF